MAHLMKAGALCHYRCALSKRSFGYRFLATKTYDPLRILFCGADEFSIASLKALHEEHIKRPDRISSIDVVCRPGKRVGRGLKKIREGTLSTFEGSMCLELCSLILSDP
jgi:methionyl-tRNA formyltransferase